MLQLTTGKTKWEHGEIPVQHGLPMPAETYFMHTVVKVDENTQAVTFEFWKSGTNERGEYEYPVNSVVFQKEEIKVGQLERFAYNTLKDYAEPFKNEGFSTEKGYKIYAELSGVEHLELANAYNKYKYVIGDAIRQKPLHMDKVTTPPYAFILPSVGNNDLITGKWTDNEKKAQQNELPGRSTDLMDF